MHRYRDGDCALALKYGINLAKNLLVSCIRYLLVLLSTTSILYLVPRILLLSLMDIQTSVTENVAEL